MLQAIRSKVGSWVVKILFVLLIVSFAVWGIGDFTSNVNTEVAEIDDTAIGQQQLDRAFRDEVNRMREMVGPDFTTEQAQRLGILDQVLEGLIQQRLLELDAAAKGIRVGDAVVARTVAEFPAFRNAFGQFDPALMRALLQQAGMNEANLVEDIRGDLARRRLVDAVTAGATSPKVLAETLFRYRAERRVADVVLIPASAMPAPAAPDDATIAQFHQDEAVRYTAPEYRTFTVATLTAQDLGDEISISEDDLREAYAARSAEFIRPETRDLVQAVLPDRDTAVKVADAAKGGKGLETAATEVGVEAVSLDDVTAEDLLPELATVAFGLNQGAVSDPIESPLGWHVLTVREITAGGETPFEAARDQLLSDLRKDRAIDRLFEVSNAMDDALAGGASIEEAAAKVGAKIHRLQDVDNQGNRAAGGAATDLPGLPRILEAGFSLPEGQTSNVTETEEAGYFAIHVEKVTPAMLRPLDTVREQVIADWTAQKQLEAARGKANEVAAGLRDGVSAESKAKEIAGAVHVRTGPLFRSAPQGEQAELPPGLLADLFELAPNGVAVGEARDGMVVARLVEVVPADPAADPSIVPQLSDSLRSVLAGDLMAQYLAGLRQRYEVSINRNLLNTMYQEQ